MEEYILGQKADKDKSVKDKKMKLRTWKSSRTSKKGKDKTRIQDKKMKRSKDGKDKRQK